MKKKVKVKLAWARKEQVKMERLLKMKARRMQQIRVEQKVRKVRQQVMGPKLLTFLLSHQNQRRASLHHQLLRVNTLMQRKRSGKGENISKR